MERRAGRKTARSADKFAGSYAVTGPAGVRPQSEVLKPVIHPSAVHIEYQHRRV